MRKPCKEPHMCYAKPGPRCSPHTRSKVIASRKAYTAAPSPATRDAFLNARAEYDQSPEGVDRLRFIVEYNITNNKKTDLVLKRLRDGEQSRHTAMEALAVSQAQGQPLQEDVMTVSYNGRGFDEAGFTDEGLDNHGLDAEGFDAIGVNPRDGSTLEEAEAALAAQPITQETYDTFKEIGSKHLEKEERLQMRGYANAVRAVRDANGEFDDVKGQTPLAPKKEATPDIEPATPAAAPLEIPESANKIRISPWTNPSTGEQRNYLNNSWGKDEVAEVFGYTVDRHKTGNIASASRYGSTIPNGAATRELEAIGKVWVVDKEGEQSVHVAGEYEPTDEEKNLILAIYDSKKNLKV